MTSLSSFMRNLVDKLVDIFNLSEYEARVYVTLCGFDCANISQIAQVSEIARTAIYPSLSSLLNKGFVFRTIQGKRKYYKALSPDQLEAVFDRKKSNLKFLIEGLSPKRPLGHDNFSVYYFPGQNGLHSAAELFLKDTTTKTWWTFESGTVNHPTLEFHQFEDFIKRRAEKGIFAKVILAINILYPWLTERINKNKEEFREILLVPEKKFPFEVVLGINEDSVLVLSGEKNSFGAVIKNVNLARTFKVIHSMIWSYYKNGSEE